MTIINKKKKIIIPLKDKCDCGKKVTSHHFLCDKCYSIKQKRKHNKIQTRLVKQYKLAQLRKRIMKTKIKEKETKEKHCKNCGKVFIEREDILSYCDECSELALNTDLD
jgi:hypothetical protein